jgi:hypothetical protein
MSPTDAEGSVGAMKPRVACKLAADTDSVSNEFDACWALLSMAFLHLRHFACALSIVFPGSSSVESDRYSKERSQLIPDISLES